MSDSNNLRKLADWFDAHIEHYPGQSDSYEIQQDLRRIADELEQRSQVESTPGNYSVRSAPGLTDVDAHRTEKCRIKMTLTKEVVDQHRKDIKKLTSFDLATIKEGDTLHVDYKLLLEYFGNTVNRISKHAHILLEEMRIVESVCENKENF